VDFTVLTLFPQVLDPYMSASIPARAIAGGHITYKSMDIREFSQDKHRRVDDAPFSGGAGMVMAPDPLFRAIAAAKAQMPQGSPVVYMSPAGRTLTNRIARDLAQLPGIILLCGHYEGMDQRVIDTQVDMELSIGDYVLTGGELAALVVMDAVMRFIPGVVGNQSVHMDESFENGLLEAPQYTRPADYNGLIVPPILLSGHAANIAKYRREQALLRTARMRPDLFEKAEMTEKERRQTLAALEAEK